MIAWLPAAMLMQVGADPHVYKQADLPVITQQRRDAPKHDAPKNAALADPLTDCMTQAQTDPAAGMAYARDWLSRATTSYGRVRAHQCMGLILSGQGDFTGAQTAFADAVAAIPAAQAVSSVPLLAMAGNAALASGDPARALQWFDRALAIKNYGDAPAEGAIESDRARALVALDRVPEAATALADARHLAPSDAGVFLLSATLARRSRDLTAAQDYIETAARIDPRDPAIGVEAGVIAELAGHEDAARKSWNSVVTTAPDSEEAATARGYLAQLGQMAPAAHLDRGAQGTTSRTAH